jgi:NTE family protein
LKALVISGGGSKGAFAGGLAEYFILSQKKNYDLFVGCSAGSLLVPFLALHEIERIKQAYTNVNQADVFNVSPFKVKEFEDGTFKSSMNHLSNIMMFIRRKRTFGETQALRQTIKNIYTEDLHLKAQELKLKVAITVSNLTLNIVEYKYLSDHNYEDFCDWIWASTLMEDLVITSHSKKPSMPVPLSSTSSSYNPKTKKYVVPSPETLLMY